MTATSTEAGFTLRRVQQMLGLSRTTIARLIEAGFIAPVRGTRNGYRFTFQDLMLLRTAFTLQEAKIPPRKILRALTQLKAELPDNLPLTGLRITAVGGDVAVRDLSGPWQAYTGQLLMDFEVSTVAGSVSFLPMSTPASTPITPIVMDWFGKGVALENEDLVSAEAAYRQAIVSDPGQSRPYLNLGALLCEAGRCGEAVELYETAVEIVGHDPLVHFNHAIALEDEHRLEDAIAAYERVLAMDSNCADAHHNMALLLESQGDDVKALRHFNMYRCLERNRER